MFTLDFEYTSKTLNQALKRGHVSTKVKFDPVHKSWKFNLRIKIQKKKKKNMRSIYRQCVLYDLSKNLIRLIMKAFEK